MNQPRDPEDSTYGPTVYGPTLWRNALAEAERHDSMPHLYPRHSARPLRPPGAGGAGGVTDRPDAAALAPAWRERAASIRRAMRRKSRTPGRMLPPSWRRHSGILGRTCCRFKPRRENQGTARTTWADSFEGANSPTTGESTRRRSGARSCRGNRSRRAGLRRGRKGRIWKRSPVTPSLPQGGPHDS
jgi:hypothetical protein